MLNWRRSKSTVLLAASVGALTLGPTAAIARDEVRLHPKLNGRISELEQELRIMKNRMKAIERRRAGSQQPGIHVSRTNKRVRLVIDGQVHRAVLVGATRQNTEVLHVDGDQNSTRLRFRGIAAAPGGWRVEAEIEFEIENNDSNGTRDSNPNLDDFNLRKGRIKFAHRRWGAIAIGRESTATDGIAEIDFSDKLAMYSNLATVGGGFLFTSNATGQATGSVGGQTVFASWDSFDGAARRDLIRYDTPRFYGFWASVSHANGDILSVAVRYVGGFFGIRSLRFAAGFGYDYFAGEGGTAPGSAFVAGDPSGPRQQYSGSASILHTPTGLSVTFASGTQVRGGRARRNPVSMYFKVGWQTRKILRRVGKTTVMADLFRAYHVAASDDRFQGFGLGVVQHIESLSAEVYAVYRLYDLVIGRAPSAAARNQSTIHVIMVGSRLKF
jgi:hypothetical protein